MTDRKVSESSTETAAQEAEILRLLQRQAQAWNQGDGEAFAATFVEDGHFVAVNGEHLHPRSAIARSMVEGLTGFMKGTRFSLGDQRDLHFLSPDVAILVTENRVLRPGQTDHEEGAASVQTRVAVRRDGEWLFASFQNTRIGMPTS